MDTPKVGRSKAAKLDRTIAFHSDNVTGGNAHPAINVKYRGTFPDGGTDEERNAIWESVVEDFWALATVLAHDRGYSGVFSEGRSGGWIVPFYQFKDGKLGKFNQWPGQGPQYGYPNYPDVSKTSERNKFLAFQRDIKTLLLTVPVMLAEELKQRIAEVPSFRCNQCEASMINGLFCHETGCPNTHSRYDADSDTWIKQRKCFECGCTVDADDSCCSTDQDWDS